MLIRRAVVIAGLFGVLVTTLPSVATAQVATTSRGNKVNALHLLKDLHTAPEHNHGYERTKFADWLDKDGDGCDTRAEVLIAESLRRVRKSSGCYVRSGKWLSKYDGQMFKRATNLDIDHMVPLAESWGSGAKKWNGKTRAHFANDLGYRFSLRAVSASSNRSKGDRDPSEWLPSRRSFRCEYAKEYTAVKWRWRLTVNSAEKHSLRRLIRGCSNVHTVKPHRANITNGGTGGSGGHHHRCSPHYSGACIPIRQDVDCSQITARNFHVVDRDVYNLDGDGDGIACES